MMKKSAILFLFCAMLVYEQSAAQNNAVPSQSPAIKKLAAGSSWEVSEVTTLHQLVITPGATITAPEGKSVTLTVDGVEMPVIPGYYKGKIVLTPAENIEINFSGMGSATTYNYRAAVLFENGAYIPEKSVAAAVISGEVTNTTAKDVNITSMGDKFNGIIVKGEQKASYRIVNPIIDFTGNGGNDFAGYGAAIMVSGNADATVDKANIITRGAVRTAIFAGGNAVLHVNDSYLEVHNGVLPADYNFSIDPVEMKEVPWMLGIQGNVRAVNVTEDATVYFDNTHIKAQGWGALSTDNVSNTRIYATNCLFETQVSGYGSFSLGANVSTFSKCTFKVKDMALISQDGDAVFTDSTVVNSGRFGVMYFGSGDLTIDKGTRFHTQSTLIQIKGGATNIIVDNAELVTENGIIIQMMANDDPYMANMGMPGGPGGQGGPGGPGGPGNPGGPGPDPNAGKDVNAAFSNVSLTGDLVNAYTKSGAMNVTFKNASVTGAITTGTLEHALGPNGEEITMEHPELYYLIGEVKNTYCATDEKYGVSVNLDEKSVWKVTSASYITSLTIAPGASIVAPEGYKLVMTVDGSSKSVKAGTYKGKIVLKPAKV